MNSYIDYKNFAIKDFDEINNIVSDYPFTFFNHGYYPHYDILNEEDLLFKNQASLYLNLVEGIDLNNKTVLDIGCGRGGGANILKKYFNVKSIDACDLNSNNINFAKNHFPDVKYSISEAEYLKYDDNSFDIVTNVESSHSYYNKEQFLKEVSRVLKPGGLLLHTDLFEKSINANLFIKDMSKYFNNIITTDITKNVADACEDDINNFNKIQHENAKIFALHVATDKVNIYKKRINIYYKNIGTVKK